MLDREELEWTYDPHQGPLTKSWKQPNKGEVSFPEKGPADPLASEAARMMSHRGGLADHRTQHY